MICRLSQSQLWSVNVFVMSEIHCAKMLTSRETNFLAWVSRGAGQGVTIVLSSWEMNFSTWIIPSHNNNKLISRLHLRELPAGRALLFPQDSEDGATARLRDLRQRHRADLRHGVLRLQESGPNIQSDSEELPEHQVECGHEQSHRGLFVPVLHHLQGEQLLPGLRGL